MVEESNDNDILDFLDEPSDDDVDLNSLKKQELVDLAESMGLDSSGLKQDLIDRIENERKASV